MSRHVVVLGAGVSGKSLAKYFYRLGDHVTIVDRSLKALHNIPESHVKLLEGTQELPKQVDFVVRSPGIPPTHAWVIEAKSRGISVETDIQVALKSPEFQQYPSIGVTGSNGKTTTVSFFNAFVSYTGTLRSIYGEYWHAHFRASGSFRNSCCRDKLISTSRSRREDPCVLFCRFAECMPESS